MKLQTFPAFRTDGTAVQLDELLAVIPENEWIWSIIEFYGIGEAPDDLSMDEFDELVRAKDSGFIMPWLKLKKFASSLDQTIDCLIVGAKSEKDILSAKLTRDDFTSCEIVLRAFDSTEWSVWARDVALMRKLAAVY
jgi:hypothetical protein